METAELTKQEHKAPALTAKALFNRDDVKQKFQELLGKRATSFMTSVLQIVASNDLLQKADPASIYHSAAVAATLDLPLNNNLGFAYIVPYNQKQKDGSYKTVAQFQLGYKGFIQLAQRSGQFKNISASRIYEGQLIEENPLTGFVFDFTKKKSELVIGYAAYFRLLNGFEKVLFMTHEELKAHGVRYSQTFKKGYGLWKDDFDGMAIKTVLKLLLAKFAPLSVDMQKAVIVDQGIINDTDAQEVSYADNDVPVIDKEKERIALMIDDAATVEELENISVHVEADQIDMFNDKKEQLTRKAK
jgi:recombination protein RecT